MSLSTYRIFATVGLFGDVENREIDLFDLLRNLSRISGKIKLFEISAGIISEKNHFTENSLGRFCAGNDEVAVFDVHLEIIQTEHEEPEFFYIFNFCIAFGENGDREFMRYCMMKSRAVFMNRKIT